MAEGIRKIGLYENIEVYYDPYTPATTINFSWKAIAGDPYVGLVRMNPDGHITLPNGDPLPERKIPTKYAIQFCITGEQDMNKVGVMIESYKQTEAYKRYPL